MQTISSDLAYRYILKDLRTQKKRRLDVLLNHEVLGIPVTLDISHAHAIAWASADLFNSTSLKFPRFHDTLNK